MRRLTRTELAVAMLQIGAARAKNLTVSEFESARVHIDFIFDDLVTAIKNGMPRADAISIVAVYAQVSRKVAGDILCKRLRQAGLIEAKEQAKPEKEEKSNPATALASVAVKPLPIPTSACAELKQEQPGFSVGIKIGSNFAGVDDVGRQAEQEREARRKSLANLESMEEKYGSPDKFK